VLLIVLMVTSTQIVRAQLMVDLPEAASGGDAVPSTLNVTLLASGEVLLDGSPSNLDAIASAVRAEKAQDPEVQAVIAADKGVPYGKVVEVIDTVKTNGVTKFALNIERTSGPGD
jgi:biopolymer transport protein ExbD